MCANKQDQKDIKYQVDNLSTINDIDTSFILNYFDTVNKSQEAMMQIQCFKEKQSNVNLNDVWLNLSQDTLLQQKISQLANSFNNLINKHFEGKYDKVLAFTDEEFTKAIYIHFDSLGIFTMCKNKDEFVNKCADDKEYKNNCCIELKIAVSIAEQVWNPNNTNSEGDIQKELNSILTNSYQKFPDNFVDFFMKLCFLLRRINF